MEEIRRDLSDVPCGRKWLVVSKPPRPGSAGARSTRGAADEECLVVSTGPTGRSSFVLPGDDMTPSLGERSVAVKLLGPLSVGNPDPAARPIEADVTADGHDQLWVGVAEIDVRHDERLGRVTRDRVHDGRLEMGTVVRTSFGIRLRCGHWTSNDDRRKSAENSALAERLEHVRDVRRRGHSSEVSRSSTQSS